MTPLALALKGTVVLLAAALAVRGLGRAPAAWRHAAWTAAFAVLVLLPVLAAVGPTWRVPVLPAAASAAAPALLPAGAWPWLGAVWVLGAALVGLRWVAAHAAARRLIRAATPVRSARWRQAERHARAAVGLRRPVRLLRSARLDVPAAWGIRPARRAVLLPASTAAWDDNRRRAVLLHEMAHLKRGDTWTQIVAQAAVAVHWFNPLAWAAYRRSLAERELACDDAALEAGADPADYAGHLLALARRLGRPALALAAVTPMAQRPALELRIVSILAHRHGRARTTAGGTAAAAVVAACVAVAVAAIEPVPRAAAPQLVSAPERAPAAERPLPAVPVPAATVAAPAPAHAPESAPSARLAAPSAVSGLAASAHLAEAPSPAEPAATSPRLSAARADASPLYVPLAFKAVDPDQITRQVIQLRAMVAALHDLDPETVSHQSVNEALATVPGLTPDDRAALHADAVLDLASATAAIERRLTEAETAFERDRRGGRGARGPSL